MAGVLHRSNAKANTWMQVTASKFAQYVPLTAYDPEQSTPGMLPPGYHASVQSPRSQWGAFSLPNYYGPNGRGLYGQNPSRRHMGLI